MPKAAEVKMVIGNGNYPLKKFEYNSDGNLIYFVGE